MIIGSTGNQMGYEIEQAKHACNAGLITADFGKKPKGHKSIIEKFMKKILKDPDSAKFLWDDSVGPKEGMGFDIPDNSCQGYGWTVCVPINAKNSYGGYTGPKLHFFLIRNNIITYYESPGRYGITHNCM